MRHMKFATVLIASLFSVLAWATPSTTYWAPSTTYVQPFGVPHLTYDTYFRANAAYPITTGLTIGILPFDKLQLEIGYDLLLPSHDPILLLLNAKLGVPEGLFFGGSPSLAVGIFGVGIKKTTPERNGTSWNILYGQAQKNLPWGGFVSVGGYYGAGTEALWIGDDGKPHRGGFMGAVTSPDININRTGLKKLVVVADVQTGNKEVLRDFVLSPSPKAKLGNQEREGTANSVLQATAANADSMWFLRWKGTKTPRGASILSYPIDWTQNGVVSSGSKMIGTYTRLQEFGGPDHDEHMMIVWFKQPE